MSSSVIIQPAKFQSLKRSKRDEYNLYRAALEWTLTEPIVIESREDLRSEAQWNLTVEPYQHQVSNLITFCRRLPVTLLADDVGLGKTVSAGLIASELMSRGRVSKILVVCPKLIMPQWKEELETKFNIQSEVASGRQVVETTPPNGFGAVITTYTSARIYLDALAEKGFEFLVLDEAHKLRNLYGVDPTPQVALKFQSALKNRVFKYVLMLTATPIQNRLWDIYSLVDLLTAARGHENPFGSQGKFARRFIEDNREQARRLKSDRRDEFRSIVYSHMSRTRRGDANLYFPDRKVQLHRVKPTEAELELIRLIRAPIQKLNPLAQISIAQALISSPHALAAQLEVMARNKTVPTELAVQVRKIAESTKVTAKQTGLELLVDQLRSENPTSWRMVVFTTRRETQTTIEAFLSARGISCGIINGDSGTANQKTVSQFKKNPPEIHVVISTEAGSEGVNLQSANVVVNYDLPWNPMVVEQRIGRVQRLASDHAIVCVFNVILSGTFEEYIVGRLMEKLQMASHAIGDVESLLEAAGIDDEEDSEGLEERIRKLVIASLSGKDVEESVRLAEQSILAAKDVLANEKSEIDEMLGNKSSEYSGPRCPKLPALVRALELPELVKLSVAQLGGTLESTGVGLFRLSLDGKADIVRFDDSLEKLDQSILLKPGEPHFERLVNRISSTGRHLVEDIDTNTASRVEETVRNWVDTFGGQFDGVKLGQVSPRFEGKALLKVRVTVAHDSYERLIDIDCLPAEGVGSGRGSIEPLPEFIFDPGLIGLTMDGLIAKAREEESVAEFCRFYTERLVEELNAAGSSERARKKLEDEFTPRLQVELVGLEGRMSRQVTVTANLKLDNEYMYEVKVAVIPSTSELTEGANLAECSATGRNVPEQCISTCAISGRRVVRHLLKKSDISNRFALAENTVVCAVSGKRLLADESQKSDVTGKMVDPTLLKRSELSGKIAESEYFTKCAFTSTNVLTEETSTSQISGKRFRSDQQLASAVSGKVGHASEFIRCAKTNIPLLATEAETCEVSGAIVKPGMTVTCGISGKRILTDLARKSEVSGKMVDPSLLKRSDISGRFAEPDYFTKCEFTHVDALNDETLISQVSGKRFRSDQQGRSAVSGKTGHSSEFIYCARTKTPLLASEAEHCELTREVVRPGILETCEVTGKRVLPTELVACAVTGKRAIKKELVTSSVSGALLIEGSAIKSADGFFCTPREAKVCSWNERRYHPNDLRTCALTGLFVHQDCLELPGDRLIPLVGLLNGVRMKTDRKEIWSNLVLLGRRVFGSSCEVESAQASASGNHLAVCMKVSSWLGLRIRYAGFIYSVVESSIIGSISIGRRENGVWVQDPEGGTKVAAA